MIAVAIFPVFYFFFPKLNLFPVLHCALSLFRAFLDCVIDRKVRDVIFEAILSPSERYQNIQDNPEYNGVLPFRIILKIFTVNMLQFGIGVLLYICCIFSEHFFLRTLLGWQLLIVL